MRPYPQALVVKIGVGWATCAGGTTPAGGLRYPPSRGIKAAHQRWQARDDPELDDEKEEGCDGA